jgi:MFS family permease
VTQFGLYLMASALPLYMRDLGVAQSRIGFEVSLGSLSAIAVALFIGPSISRYGSRLFLTLGAFIYLVSAVGMLVFAREETVSALRALQGVGTAFITPGAATWGVKLMPDRPSTALSILSATTNVALAIGPPIGLILYVGHGAGWLFIPVIGAAALGLTATRALPAEVFPRRQLGGFGFDMKWLPSLLTNMLGVANFGGILAYLPIYLSQRHGPNAGIFFTADAVGVLVFRIPTGLLADRYGSLVPNVLGLLLTVVGVALLALPPSIFALVLAGAGTGIGAGLFLTGINGDLARMSTDANRGTALSFISVSFSMGIFGGGAISGLLIGPGGFNAIVVLGCVTAAAALPVALLGRRRVSSFESHLTNR